MAAQPGILHVRRMACGSDLLHDVELAQAINPIFEIRDAIELSSVTGVNILYVPEPVIEKTKLTRTARRMNAAAAVVTADDNVLDLQDLDCELNDGEAAHVGVDNEVRNVAMDEHLAWLETQDMIGGNTAI